MTTTTDTYHVFVYGTLKGMRRGKFLGHASTILPYVMFDGGFPLVIEKDHPILEDVPDHAGRVVGELYEVSGQELEGLDDYEGCNPDKYDSPSNFYSRREIQVATKNGTEITAWMYFGERATEGIPMRQQKMPNPLGELLWP